MSDALDTLFQMNSESLYWNTMANDRLAEINKQLLTIAFALIPLIGGVAISPISINETAKTLLIISLFFLLGSIVMGFVDIAVSAKFFSDYAKLNSKRAHIYATSKSDEVAQKKIDELPPLSEQTTNIYLAFQAAGVGIAFIFIAVSVGILLSLR